MAIPLSQRGPRADWEGGGILWPRTLKNATPYVTRLAERGQHESEASTPLAQWNSPPPPFRAYFNDPGSASCAKPPSFNSSCRNSTPHSPARGPETDRPSPVYFFLPLSPTP